MFLGQLKKNYENIKSRPKFQIKLKKLNRVSRMHGTIIKDKFKNKTRWKAMMKFVLAVLTCGTKIE